MAKKAIDIKLIREFTLQVQELNQKLRSLRPSEIPDDAKQALMELSREASELRLKSESLSQ